MLERLLESSDFIDAGHPAVQAFAREAVGDARGARQRAVRLFYAVRDEIRYDPYAISRDPRTYRASHVAESGVSYCIPKSVLLCAAARAVGLPALLGFADVRNHLTTPRLAELMGTDVFCYHGYTSLWIEGRWVKATSAFNIELCERFGVRALEFDGEHDALLHPFDRGERRHMEYLSDHGTFEDLPFDRIMDAFCDSYPRLMLHAEARARGEPLAERFGDGRVA